MVEYHTLFVSCSTRPLQLAAISGCSTPLLKHVSNGKWTQLNHSNWGTVMKWMMSGWKRSCQRCKYWRNRFLKELLSKLLTLKQLGLCRPSCLCLCVWLCNMRCWLDKCVFDVQSARFYKCFLPFITINIVHNLFIWITYRLFIVPNFNLFNLDSKSSDFIDCHCIIKSIRDEYF